EQEFQERENDLSRQIEELQERAAAPAAGTAQPALDDIESRISELDEREQQLALRENEVRERRFETERQSVALRHGQQLWEQQRGQQQRELADDRTRLELDFR